jgi:outer membrane receptor protein involved in Fe transport
MRALIPQELLESANLTSVGADGVTNRNDVDNLGDTEDIEAKGVELELIYNPVRNWRISLNVAQQETIVSNFSPRMGQLIDQFGDILATGDASRLRYFVNAESDPPQFSSDPFPDPDGPTATNAEWIEVNVLAPYRNLKSQEGRVSAEQREWRVNFVTNYNFSRKSPLNGWGIGSAVRWQDGAIIGYPTKFVDGLLISDIDNPHVAPSETTIDAWIRYRRPIFNGKVDFSIELRVFNLNTDSDDLIPVRSKNTEEYAVAVWRVGPPRTYRITCDFKF